MFGRVTNEDHYKMFKNATNHFDQLPKELHGNSLISDDESLTESYFNYSRTIAEHIKSEDPSRRDPLYIVIPITIIYVAIFLTGVVGNISTCVVIARNKSMHTATNYYLFSLAISDLLLLVSGLPPEMYYIWSQFPYVFGEVFCAIQSFAAETSANATVLTITAFTVERYVAICHPFISHTMSKLSRAVKFVVAIWLLALGLAIPQAIQFGVVYSYDNGTIIEDTARCTVKWNLLEHAFEISTMLFFVVPMTIITVLYVLIGVKLRRSRLLTAVKRTSISNSINHGDSARGKTAAQRNVIRMLVAVVVAFFICWAPFHAQRLLAVYAQGSNTEDPHHVLVLVYTTLTYVSGIFYYLSTTINPLLYNIMSNKFREAFKTMLSQHCGRRKSQWKNSPRRPNYYSALAYRQRNGGGYPRQRENNRQSVSVSISEEVQRPTLKNQPVLDEIDGVHGPGFQKEYIELGMEGLAGKEITPLNTSKDGLCREIKRSVSRGSSDSSQVTVMTSVSKKINEGNNNSAVNTDGNCDDHRVTKKSFTGSNPRSQKTVVLGILADRLRFGTKGLFASEIKNSRPKVRPEVASAPPRLRSEASIESANTISNSSLQDLDETEFTGSELARYMGEVNFDLIT